MMCKIAHAALLWLIVFGAVVIYARLQETALQTEPPADAASLCVGIEFRNDVLGVACALPDTVLRRAVSDLGLRSDCEGEAPLKTIRHGDLLIFGERGGKCVLLETGRLTGASRLALGLPLDVNEETVSDLGLLPGIGPVKAAAIVEERTRNGAFENMEDLLRVKGIGQKTAEKLLPWIEFQPFQSGSK